MIKYSAPALSEAGRGSTFLQVDKAAIAELEVPFAPVDEQRRIAEILDRADAIRRKRHEALALTEQLLRSTFLEMFGDPIKNSKDWPLVVISDLGNVITGNTPSRSDSDNFGSGIEWIKSDNITSASFYVDEASERLSEIGAERARIAPSGSVLITCIAGSLSCIGNVALTNRDVAFNQQINAIVPNEIQAAPFIYMQTLLMKEVLQAESTGGMKGMLSKGRLSSIKYIQPPRPQIHDFGRRFDSCWSQHRRIQESALEADGLFESLTHRAFTGQL